MVNQRSAHCTLEILGLVSSRSSLVTLFFHDINFSKFLNIDLCRKKKSTFSVSSLVKAKMLVLQELKILQLD